MELNKQIRKPTAVIVLVMTAVISIAISYLYLHSLRKQYASMEQDSPESAITEYFRKISQKSYEELYQEAEEISPDSNSEEAYIQKLQSVYDGVNTDAIDYSLESSDETSYTYALRYHNADFGKLLIRQNEEGTWIASTLFEGNETWKIEVPSGLTLLVNGSPVSDDQMISSAVVPDNFSGMYDQSSVPLVDIYELTNLLDQPEVSIEGDDSYTVLKDVSSNTLYAGKTSEDQNLIQAMIDDTQTAAAYPAQDASLAEVAAVSITDSDWYSRISTLENYWFTDHTESNFSNQSVMNLIQQSDHTALAYVTMDYYATNGEVERTWHCGYQVSLINLDGSWKIAQMTVDQELNPALSSEG